MLAAVPLRAERGPCRPAQNARSRVPALAFRRAAGNRCRVSGRWAACRNLHFRLTPPQRRLLREELLDRSASVTLSIPTPRDRHDAILRETIAPLIRELDPSPQLDAAYFERFNKPHWGIRLHLLGAGNWIDEQARPLLELRIRAVVGEFAFVPEGADDKWIGGRRERDSLKRIHHLDTRSCLERLEAEARGAPAGSRAQFSLLLIERLLDLFGLAGDARLEFYRRGFRWAVDLGRWDHEVFAALEEKYASQKDALQWALDCRPGESSQEAWGGAESAAIALRHLDSVREAVQSILTAHAGSRPEKEGLDLAIFAAHAHANRLGIHATQEATLRYLVWRARGGAPGGCA